MKHIIAIAAAVLLAAAPVQAEETGDDRILPSEEELRQLGDLAEQMFRRFAEEAAPMAERLKALIDDMDAYEAPELLPNGDIIIRRKREPDVARPEAETEDGVAL